MSKTHLEKFGKSVILLFTDSKNIENFKNIIDKNRFVKTVTNRDICHVCSVRIG